MVRNYQASVAGFLRTLGSSPRAPIDNRYKWNINTGRNATNKLYHVRCFAWYMDILQVNEGVRFQKETIYAVG